MTTLPPLLQKERELFEKSFNRQHGQFTHLGEKREKTECLVCKEDRELNPKGYYKTFLTEKECYWNDEMYKDVESFLTASHTRVLTALLGEIEPLEKTKSMTHEETYEIDVRNGERNRIRSLIHSLLGR